MKKKLPIGIQSFSELITGGYSYVDKTPFIARLVNSGKVYFLSRPRRFGKSLLLDTMACAFSGKRGLFKRLYLDTPESEWDWDVINPVLRADFAGGTMNSPDLLRERLDTLLDNWAAKYNISSGKGTPGIRLLDIIPKIALETGKKIVVLFDEYDKPILDNIEDPQAACAMRDILKDFYSALKPLDEHLRFVFFTGVSKFAKTGIFSGLNNLHDITISFNYSAICGYTQTELESVFADYLESADKNTIREWYNGYNWNGESVYNPFDVLLYFSENRFRAFWFETGTPTFLVKLWKIEPRNPAEYDGLIAGEETLESFEITNLSLTTLLFQAGYLTIHQVINDPVRGARYVIGFPNLEVRKSVASLLLIEASGIREKEQYADRLGSAIERNNPEDMHLTIRAFLASIPHDWHRRNNIAEYEGYWSTIFYTLFAGMGYEVIPEDVTSRGNIDMTVKTAQSIWIFEFKVKDTSGSRYGFNPLAQIEGKKYAAKYRNAAFKDGKSLPIFQLGIVFDSVTRSIEKWEVQSKETT